jgi:hypothetical protein
VAHHLRAYYFDIVLWPVFAGHLSYPFA